MLWLPADPLPHHEPREQHSLLCPKTVVLPMLQCLMSLHSTEEGMQNKRKHSNYYSFKICFALWGDSNHRLCSLG